VVGASSEAAVLDVERFKVCPRIVSHPDAGGQTGVQNSRRLGPGIKIFANGWSLFRGDITLRVKIPSYGRAEIRLI
jgi:hypothetical protein